MRRDRFFIAVSTAKSYTKTFEFCLVITNKTSNYKRLKRIYPVKDNNRQVKKVAPGVATGGCRQIQIYAHLFQNDLWNNLFWQRSLNFIKHILRFINHFPTKLSRLSKPSANWYRYKNGVKLNFNEHEKIVPTNTSCKHL